MTLPMIMSCSMYYSVPGLRDLCHAVKSRDDDALTESAEWLSDVVDKYDLEGYSIIPIPNHSGRAEYTLEILKRLRRIRNIHIYIIYWLTHHMQPNMIQRRQVQGCQ